MSDSCKKNYDELYLLQAIDAYPWLSVVLERDDVRRRWIHEIRLAIANGEKLSELLAEMFRVSPGTIVKMHRLSSKELLRFCVDPSNILCVSRVAQVLQHVPVDYVPKKASDWQVLADAMSWLLPMADDALRSRCMGTAYASVQRVNNEDSLMVLSDRMPIFRAFSYIRMVLACEDVYYRSTRIVCAQNNLPSFIFAYLVEKRGLRWVTRLQKRHAKQMTRIRSETPLLPLVKESFDWRSQYGYRLRISPFRTIQQMRDEGQYLGNCMSDLIDRALLGRFSPYFTVIDDTQSVKAHLELEYKSCNYSVRQIRGQGNQEASNACAAAANDFVLYLNQSGTMPPVRTHDAVIEMYKDIGRIFDIERLRQDVIRYWGLVAV